MRIMKPDNVTSLLDSAFVSPLLPDAAVISVLLAFSRLELEAQYLARYATAKIIFLTGSSLVIKNVGPLGVWHREVVSVLLASLVCTWNTRVFA